MYSVAVALVLTSFLGRFCHTACSWEVASSHGLRLGEQQWISDQHALFHHQMFLALCACG